MNHETHLHLTTLMLSTFCS